MTQTTPSQPKPLPPVPFPPKGTRLLAEYQEPPKKNSSWKLALFSEPTNRETLPTKVLEVFALGFCVVQTLVFLCVSAVVLFLLFFGSLFAGPPGLVIFLLGALLTITLDLCLFSMSLGFVFRKKWALFWMIAFTVIMLVITLIVLYFYLPHLFVAQNDPTFDVSGIYNLLCVLTAFSLQYLPSIIVGLIMYRRLR